MNATIRKVEQLEEKIRKAVGEDKLPRGLENSKNNFNSKKFLKLAEELREIYKEDEK